MSEDRTIKKAKSMIDFCLEEIEKYEEKIKVESNEKKIEKLKKKIKLDEDIIISNGQKIGEFGENLEEYANELSTKQRERIEALFPYGFSKGSIETQEKRNEIINSYKDRIKKIQRMRETYPAYDSNAPVKEKLKNKIYQKEKDLGFFFLLAGSESGTKTYNPEWNYEEHFATSTEFTEEEREIMEYCYNVGKEYDAYFDERYGFIADIGKHISDTAGNMYENSQLHLAQRWTRNLWTKIFPDIIESMNREDKLSKKELETEAKEMTKRFIEFIRDREALEEYLAKWNELKNSDRLNGYSDNKKNTIVGKTLMGVIGEEKMWFTYAYTQIPETEQGIELLLNYTYEELGLKD